MCCNACTRVGIRALLEVEFVLSSCTVRERVARIVTAHMWVCFMGFRTTNVESLDERRYATSRIVLSVYIRFDEYLLLFLLSYLFFRLIKTF